MATNSSKKISNSEDKISCLPDHILHHIISFLPIQEAVVTSILSTKWKYLWASIPILCFCYRDFCKRKKGRYFMNFVDNVLLLHNASTIHEFSLDCVGMEKTASNIYAWMSTVVRRKVQKMILTINTPYAFPSSLFTCNALKLLRLEGDLDLGESFVRIPTKLSMSSLTEMHFDSLKFICHQSSQQVSFHLPLLQQFTLINCEWENIETVEIFVPALERWIFDDFEAYIDCEGMPPTCIKVYADNLTYMKLRITLNQRLDFHNLSSLTNATIDISPDYVNCLWVSKLVEALCNVKYLKLSDIAVEVFMDRADALAHLLTFANVFRLEVTPGERHFYEDEILSLKVAQLINLLYHLPCVESFHFTCGCLSECVDGEDAWTLDGIPQHGLAKLKSIKIKEFQGSKNELFLVKLLLKNARALEELTIISSSQLAKAPKKQMKVASQLLRFPRGSECEVNFS